MRSQAKQAELSHLMKANGVEIIGLADHKIMHSDSINYKGVNGYLLITSRAWQNNQNVPNGGVGLMMNNKLKDCITNINAISIILKVDFTGNPSTTLLVHYSPVEGNSEADEHYSLLSDSIKECPNHNIVLVIGDCNAHIGNEAAKYTYHQKTNHNGALLINLSQENHLMIANTCFQKKSAKLWTYLSDMGGTKLQLDYILINKKWKNLIKNVEACSFFASIGSDHRVISARLKLSLRKVETPAQKKLYNWSALSNNEELHHQYTIQIRNRYAELCIESEDITEKYDKLIKANNETAHLFLQTRQTSQIMKRLLNKDIKFKKRLIYIKERQMKLPVKTSNQRKRNFIEFTTAYAKTNWHRKLH